MENTFKSSVFGGFNRDDVIRYIEKPRSRASSRSKRSSRRAPASAAREAEEEMKVKLDI